MLRRFLDFLIFSSVYISACAVLMVAQANQLLGLHYNWHTYALFVFCATICSYNFHAYFTPAEDAATTPDPVSARGHLALYLLSVAGCAILFFLLRTHWIWLLGGIGLTFLYSAPKVPWPPFRFLKKIAIGKTIFLAAVWTYVTTLLPVVVSNNPWPAATAVFCASRFFFIYAICIIFDYRDREQDRRDGIRSMITYFDERRIDLLFYLSCAVFFITTLALFFFHFHATMIAALLLPGVLLVFLYPRAKRDRSDYLYYVVIDGLMALSALFTAFLAI